MLICWNIICSTRKQIIQLHHGRISCESENERIRFIIEGLVVNQVTFTIEGIQAELEQGNPIVCVLGPGAFTKTGHFIVLKEYVGAGRVRFFDPNSKSNSKKMAVAP